MEEQSKELVTIDGDEPKTTSYIVAEKLGIAHKNMVELIKDHQEKIEKHFGFLRFETAKIDGRGRPEQFVDLTENQAHYVLTLSRNTDKAMEVKALFVKAFAQAKQRLAQSGQDQIAAMQEEIRQLRERAQLLLPERVTVKHAIDVLGELGNLVKKEELAPEMDAVKRYDLEFALKKAQAGFKGHRFQYWNPKDKPNQWGEVRIKEYPDETNEDREARLKAHQKIREKQEAKTLEQLIIEHIDLHGEETIETMKYFITVPLAELKKVTKELVFAEILIEKKEGKDTWYHLADEYKTEQGE